ncbi:hypothetical protein VW41_22735 [Klebsiella michiganensis]|nr:hypothetical protein VW41_22735 [Klebsiella michiganensis]
MSGGSSFKDLIGRVNDIELKSLLTTILTESTLYLGEVPAGYVESISNQPFPAYETYRAYQPKFEIILSLHSADHWEDDEITLLNNQNISKHYNIPTHRLIDFTKTVDKWEKIITYIIRKQEVENGYLAYAVSLKKIIPECIYELYKSSITNPQIKIEVIRRMAKFIAELNNYNFDASTSQKNRNGGAIRDIFYCDQKDIYLSTDVTHGRFEVLDRSGIHLCEINFDGDITKPRDKTGAHNITI